MAPYVAEDDRIILRVAGRLYEQRLGRIREGEIIAPVMAALGRKYGFSGRPEIVAEGHAWLYEVKPR